MYEPVYFKPHEWKCKCLICQADPKLAPSLSESLLRFLDTVRASHGHPIIMTSGWRCPDHNKVIKGASPDSLHVIGQAADIWSVNLPKLVEICRRVLRLPEFDPIELRVYAGHVHVALK